MKQLLTLLTLIFVSCSLAAQQDNGIRFRDITYEQALEASKQENKMIFMHGYASWCHYCVYMNDSVYPKKEVGDFYNENFICIKLNLEKEGAELNKRLLVHTFPTLVFFNAEGEVVHRAAGRHLKPMFLELGREAMEPRRQLLTWQRLFNNGNASPDTAYTYLRKVEVAGMDVQPEALKYLTKLKPDEITTAKNWRIINELYKDVSVPFMLTLIRLKPDFEKLYTTEAVNNKFMDIYKFEFYMRTRQLDSLGYERIKQSIKASKLDIGDMICDYADLNRMKQKSEYTAYLAAAPSFIEKYCANDATRLNEIAQVFYERTVDKVLLATAEKWAKKSVELKDSYTNNETLAGILIQLGNKEEARTVTNHAIEVAKKNNNPHRKALLFLDKIEQME